MSVEATRTRYVRLPAEIVVEVTDPQAVRAAARAAVESVTDMPKEERAEALTRIAAADDIADAVALIVDLAGLLANAPGLEVIEVTWSAEEDPDFVPMDEDI